MVGRTSSEVSKQQLMSMAAAAGGGGGLEENGKYPKSVTVCIPDQNGHKPAKL